MLTPDQGKLRLMARGVRKIKSKLAGGIELFSISELSFMPGRGDLGTLVSTRLVRHYGDIVKDINRVQLGYDFIKKMNRATEDEPEAEYFDLLDQSLAALNNSAINIDLIRVWFAAQLLRQAGHTPNLKSDTEGKNLVQEEAYDFDFDAMAFKPEPAGSFIADNIKFLRLAFSSNPPTVLNQVKGAEGYINASLPLVQAMLQNHIRI
jgi:DNA repair protein RecO (recombination protein O)